MSLEEIAEQIRQKYIWWSSVFVEDNKIVFEEDYEMGEDEKNDNDCCDQAQVSGQIIIADFHMLEISNYYCHRHKYAIVELKLKTSL